MSKNIIIQEGGTGKQLTASKLKTALVGGGSCLWVPEDETQLTTLYASEDGTYTAESEGYYGFSQVTVSGCGACVGYDSDGHIAMATTDPETGEIVISKLPTKIKITTEPAKLDYANGEAIDLTWIVVKAYTDNDILWTDENHPNGVIPISELVLPVPNADATQVKDASYSSDLSTGPATQPIPSGGSCLLYTRKYEQGQPYDYLEKGASINGTGAVFVHGGSGEYTYCAVAGSTSPGGSACVGISRTAGTPAELVETEYPTSSEYTHNNQTVYYYAFSTGLRNVSTVGGMPVEVSSDPFGYAAQIAWTLVYGTMDPGSGHQEIPVEWRRPGDLQALTDSFYITVSDPNNAQSGASMGEATGGGGYTVGGGAGRN